MPQAAGATNDSVARIISTELGKPLNKSVVVENRPGASGAIGTQEGKRAKPDAYTLVTASDSTASMNVIRPSFA
ncbi:MAG: tripartite tricarboxylate transporter substrate-binding protein [Burkholderiales bacterium]